LIHCVLISELKSQFLSIQNEAGENHGRVKTSPNPFFG